MGLRLVIIKPARLSEEHNTKYSQIVVHLCSPLNRRGDKGDTNKGCGKYSCVMMNAKALFKIWAKNKKLQWQVKAVHTVVWYTVVIFPLHRIFIFILFTIRRGKVACNVPHFWPPPKYSISASPSSLMCVPQRGTRSGKASRDTCRLFTSKR